MSGEDRLPVPISLDDLATDLSDLSDEELGRRFHEADRRQAVWFLMKCKIVATYRAGPRGESWTDQAQQQFGRSRRTLEAYAAVWDTYCELDADAQAKIPRLADSASLMQHVGRLSALKRPQALMAAISYVDEFGEVPTVRALKGRLAETAAGSDITSAEYSLFGPADHSAIQFRLLALGTALGYDVWIPHGDRSRAMRFSAGEKLSLSESLPPLAPGNRDAQETISRIDVIWLVRAEGYYAAFEVERTTAIHSGILRLSDLASAAPNVKLRMFIVAPDDRARRVIRELNRPTFRKEPLDLHKRCRLITFEDLISETETLGDRVRMLKGPEFLTSISKECDRPTAEFPEDSDE